ncbi:ATP-binding protein [Larkinella soli]|uniref:ATP-binding protein n=1 Tax=Larkinella soli TaxID=1770527 RepID=UPI000FFC9DCC|nr:ATP-binding protein [Larkinella soli]
MSKASPSALPLGLLQGVLDCSQNGVMVYQSLRNEQGEVYDFRLMALNKSAEKDLGIPSKELLGRRLTELFSNLPRDAVFDQYRQVVESGEAIRFEVTHLLPGRRRATWLDISAVKLEDGLVMSYNDITERKHAAQTLQEQADLFNLALNSSANGITLMQAIRDPDGRAVDLQTVLVNNRGVVLSGLTREELLGKSMLSIYRSEPSLSFCRRLLDVMNTGKPLHMEQYFQGENLWLSVLVTRYSDEGIALTYSDITHTKTVEIARQEQAALVNKVMDTVHSGILLCQAIRDEENEITDFQTILCNEESGRLTGFSRDELLTTAIRDLDPYGFLGQLYPEFREVVLSGQSLRKEYHMARKDVWIDCSISQFGDGVVVTCTDVSNLRHSQEELEHRNQELKSSNENLQQFAYVASHDLQEPLRKIQSFADILQNHYGQTLDERALDILSRMQQASGRMSGLIKDLLTYSRISTHREPLRRLSLNKLLDEVLNDLEMTVREKSAVIERPSLPEVNGDPTQLRQLFQNLLSNALKFQHGDTIPRIKIDCRAVTGKDIPEVAHSDLSRPFYEISISDNGIGFDAKHMDRIFQLFQRLHGRSQYSGTGIGLAICKKVMENHKGYIWAESSPGRGATFQVYLPSSQPAESVN